MPHSLWGLLGGDSSTDVRLETVGVDGIVLEPAAEDALFKDAAEDSYFILGSNELCNGRTMDERVEEESPEKDPEVEELSPVETEVVEDEDLDETKESDSELGELILAYENRKREKFHKKGGGFGFNFLSLLSLTHTHICRLYRKTGPRSHVSFYYFVSCPPFPSPSPSPYSSGLNFGTRKYSPCFAGA